MKKMYRSDVYANKANHFDRFISMESQIKKDFSLGSQKINCTDINYYLLVLIKFKICICIIILNTRRCTLGTLLLNVYM